MMKITNKIARGTLVLMVIWSHALSSTTFASSNDIPANYIVIDGEIEVIVLPVGAQEAELQLHSYDDYLQMKNDPRYEFVEPNIKLETPTPIEHISISPPLIQSPSSTKSQEVVSSQAVTDDPWLQDQSYLYTSAENGNAASMGFFAAKALSEQNKRVRVGIVDDTFFAGNDIIFSQGENFISDSANSSSRGDGIYVATQAELDDCYSGHGLSVTQAIFGISDNGLEGAGGIDNVDIIAARALRCGNGSLFNVSIAIRWLAGKSVGYGVTPLSEPVDVINLSLSGNLACPSYMQSAIDIAHDEGIMIVVAAGNNSKNLDVFEYAPANCNNVVTVASTNFHTAKSGFSNYGEAVDIAAVGQAIIAPSNTYPSNFTNKKLWSGTSFSAPMVTAAYALLKQTFPDMTPAQGLQLMQQSATEPVETYNGSSNLCFERCGAGSLNVFAMMQAAYAMHMEHMVFSNVIADIPICDLQVMHAAASDKPTFCNTYNVDLSGFYGNNKAIMYCSEVYCDDVFNTDSSLLYSKNAPINDCAVVFASPPAIFPATE